MFEQPSKPDRKNLKYFRLVLPFRREWSLARIHSVLREADKKYALRPMFSDDFPAASRVVWKLGGKHLVHRIRGLNAFMSVNPEKYSIFL